jgi:hypothetical protein
MFLFYLRIIIHIFPPLVHTYIHTHINVIVLAIICFTAVETCNFLLGNRRCSIGRTFVTVINGHDVSF